METINQLEYWKKRCELAEMYIQESPCDPDITNSQLAAYGAWNHFKIFDPEKFVNNTIILKDRYEVSGSNMVFVCPRCSMVSDEFGSCDKCKEDKQ